MEPRHRHNPCRPRARPASARRISMKLRPIALLTLTMTLAVFLLLSQGCGGKGRRGIASRGSVQIPQNAVLMSYGMFPMPPFHPPESGTVYVLEEETGKVILVFALSENVDSVDFQSAPPETQKNF